MLSIIGHAYLDLDYSGYHRICISINFNPIQTGGAFAPPLAKKLNNFKTVQARATKLGDFSYNLFGNTLKSSWRLISIFTDWIIILHLI